MINRIREAIRGENQPGIWVNIRLGEMHNSEGGGLFKIYKQYWAITSYATNPEYYIDSCLPSKTSCDMSAEPESGGICKNEVTILAKEIFDSGISYSHYSPGSTSNPCTLKSAKSSENSPREGMGGSKVGLGIISSLAEEALARNETVDTFQSNNIVSSQLVKGYHFPDASSFGEVLGSSVADVPKESSFDELMGSSVEIETAGDKVDVLDGSSFDEPLDSSVQVTKAIPENKVDGPNGSSSGGKPPLDSSEKMTKASEYKVVLINIGGRGISIRGGRGCYLLQEWPCVFAGCALSQNFVNQNLHPDFVTGPVSLSSRLITGSDASPNLFPMTICRKHGNAGFLTLEEIKNTDNYTRTTVYLPYPTVTHMYNNCILEFPPNQLTDFTWKKPPGGLSHGVLDGRPSSNKNFLRNCEACRKPLEGKDIYIYRGDSSFCSEECRYYKVMSDKEFLRVINCDKKPDASTSTAPPSTSSTNTPSSSSKKKVVFYVGDAPPGA